jgi:hypothetical protein
LGNLSTPKIVQKLQKALHAKAKAEAGYRFYALYDKISREDILAHAFAQCRSNKGAPGVDGQDFADIEAYGVERWLGELALALRRRRSQRKARHRNWWGLRHRSRDSEGAQCCRCGSHARSAAACCGTHCCGRHPGFDRQRRRRSQISGRFGSGFGEKVLRRLDWTPANPDQQCRDYGFAGSPPNARGLGDAVRDELPQPFCLDDGLHAALAAASGARIVSVSSSANMMAPVFFDDPNFNFIPYNPWLACGQSKTATPALRDHLLRKHVDRDPPKWCRASAARLMTSIGRFANCSPRRQHRTRR